MMIKALLVLAIFIAAPATRPSIRAQLNNSEVCYETPTTAVFVLTISTVKGEVRRYIGKGGSCEAAKRDAYDQFKGDIVG